jgi:hypothetical protein
MQTWIVLQKIRLGITENGQRLLHYASPLTGNILTGSVIYRATSATFSLPHLLHFTFTLVFSQVYTFLLQEVQTQ